jgi:hypothetical protein
MRQGIDRAQYRSDRTCRVRVGPGGKEVVLGTPIIPDLVGAADRNGGDDSAIDVGEVAAGDVDDDGLGRCGVPKCGAATEQRLVVRSEC